MPRLSLRNVFLALLVLIVVGGAVFLLIQQPPEFLKKAVFWMIGLAGFIYTGFRKLLDLFGSGERLDELDQRNEQLKQDSERLKQEISEASRRFEQERAEYHREIARLEASLAEQQQRYAAARERLARIEEMTPEEYIASLPEDEQRRFRERIYRGVTPIGEPIPADE